MRDMILNTNILPEPLFAMIHTEKIRVHETNGELRITLFRRRSPLAFPINFSLFNAMTQAEYKVQRLNDFRGSGADLEITVDTFLKMTHDDTEIDHE